MKTDFLWRRSAALLIFAIGSFSFFSICFHATVYGQNGKPQFQNTRTSNQQTGQRQDLRQQNGQQRTTQPQGGQLRPMNGGNGNLQNQNGRTQTPAQLASNTNPRQPKGFPISASEQQFVDQLLTVWETRSSKIKRYQFEFVRWIYMSQVCNYRDPKNNKLVAATKARGSVRYQAPDKGMYEVYAAWKFAGEENVVQNGVPVVQNGVPLKKAKYTAIKTNGNNPAREKWICDGKSIFEYDFEGKRITETELPREFQGAGLRNSPIPFVFGIKAQEMKERFWIRPIYSENKDVFIIEAHPRRREDAQNYKKLVIYLSREPYLPLQMEMYASNYDERTNQSYTVFQFTKRQVDGTLSGITQFAGNFIRPSLPGIQWKFQKGAGSANNTSRPNVGSNTNIPQKNSTQRK